MALLKKLNVTRGWLCFSTDKLARLTPELDADWIDSLRNRILGIYGCVNMDVRLLYALCYVNL
jgi:hypothetical protein